MCVCLSVDQYVCVHSCEVSVLSESWAGSAGGLLVMCSLAAQLLLFCSCHSTAVGMSLKCNYQRYGERNVCV